jgi:hypothetical protein
VELEESQPAALETVPSIETGAGAESAGSGSPGLPQDGRGMPIEVLPYTFRSSTIMNPIIHRFFRILS